MNDKLTNAITHDAEKDVGEFPTLPPCSKPKLNKLLEYILENLEDDFGELPEDLSRDIYTSASYRTSLEDVETKDLSNKIEYDGRKLRDGVVNLGSGSGNILETKFCTEMGVGGACSYLLRNSGFWITLSPPTNIEKVGLQYALAKEEIELGRTTNRFIHSNFSIIYERIIMDYVKEHIVDSSVNCSKQKLMSMILSSDFYTILVMLLDTFNPDGYSMTQICRNVGDDSVSMSKRCGNKVSGVIRPSLLILSTDASMDEEYLKHISSRASKSMSVNSVLAIQKSMDTNQPEEVEVCDGLFTMTLNVPYMVDRITMGNAWVNKITSSINSLIAEADSESIRSNKILDLTNSVIMGIYNTYVTKLSNPQGTEVTNPNDIIGILERLSKKPEVINSFMGEVNKFLKNKTNTVIGITDYECSKCVANGKDGYQTSDSDGDKDDPSSKIIPIEMFELFLDLGDLKIHE